MAYVVPTLNDFRARFPEFTKASDATVNAVLSEAIAEVGETWIEADRRSAQLYLAAHLLTAGGALMRDAAGNLVAGPVTSKSVGGVSVAYANTASSAPGMTGSGVGYAATVYGQRFLALRRRSFPPILAV